ncbi:MAG: hypothetical protein R2795_07700 [Saprospiraceae bacterium]
MKRILSISFLFFLVVVTFTCTRKRDVKPLPEGAKAWLYGYTTGLISRIDPITVQFSGLAVNEEEVGQEVANNLVDIVPDAGGKWVWVDRQTMRFTPEPALAFATTYIVTVQLGKIFDNVPAEAASFDISVTTRDPYVSLKLEGLQTPDVKQRGKRTLTGMLLTSDFVPDAEAAALLTTATQAGKALEVTWSQRQWH